MKRLLRENGLSLVMFGLFFVFVIGQALTGFHESNDDRQQHHQTQLTFSQYLVSGHFVEAIFENWESEFLQMGAYVLLTTFLYQKGSPESKKLNEEEATDAEPDEANPPPNAPWPVRRGGFILALYKYSLSGTLFLLFFISLLLHAAGGAHEYSREQAAHGEASVTTLQYMGTSRFWFESFQNWQSEFLSVGVLVVLSIFLRQKGSPESKPVDHPHSETGE
ncbi:MAG: DUF6766 family protein [Pyrinomonadaceae bacterium]